MEPTDNVLSLALAVARANSNALPINADNGSDGQWIPITEAVESGSAFAVEVKPTLVALDLDTPELIELGDTIRHTIHRPTLLVESGRNRHLYVYAGRNRDEVVRQVKEQGIPAAAIRQTIRPPLSTHRLGYPVRLIEPATVEEALEALGPVDRITPLPGWVLTLIEDGDVSNRFGGNRSNMAITIASAMKRAGCTLSDFRAVMMNRSNLGAKKAHELADQDKDVDAFIVRTWDRAEAGGFDPEAVESAKIQVLEHNWSGRTGRTDRAAMLALCDLALTSGTSTPTFGIRNLAEAAQIGSKTTVSNALDRLVKAGWIRRIPASSPGQADGYMILDRRAESGGPKVGHLIHRGDGNKCPSYGPPIDDSLRHPVFRNGSGLGKTTGAVWVALHRIEGPATRKKLAELAGCSLSSVTRAMEKLTEHGLAARTEKGWVAVGGPESLDEVALRIGAAEQAQRQVELHDRHREGYRVLQAQRQSTAVESPTSAMVEPEELNLGDDLRRWNEEHRLLMGMV